MKNKNLEQKLEAYGVIYCILLFALLFLFTVGLWYVGAFFLIVYSTFVVGDLRSESQKRSTFRHLRGHSYDLSFEIREYEEGGIIPTAQDGQVILIFCEPWLGSWLLLIFTFCCQVGFLLAFVQMIIFFDFSGLHTVIILVILILGLDLLHYLYTGRFYTMIFSKHILALVRIRDFLKDRVCDYKLGEIHSFRVETREQKFRMTSELGSVPRAYRQTIYLNQLNNPPIRLTRWVETLKFSGLVYDLNYYLEDPNENTSNELLQNGNKDESTILNYVLVMRSLRGIFGFGILLLVVMIGLSSIFQ